MTVRNEIMQGLSDLWLLARWLVLPLACLAAAAEAWGGDKAPLIYALGSIAYVAWLFRPRPD